MSLNHNVQITGYDRSKVLVQPFDSPRQEERNV